MSTTLKNKSDMLPIPNAKGMKFAIIVAEWNKEVTSSLLEGAKGALIKAKCKKSDIDVKWVPGTLELPMAAQMLCETHAYDALIAIGCVVRGDTPHFDYVCRGAFDGLMHVQLDFATPITFGILTTEDYQQALDRAGGKLGNKGAEAAEAAIKMIGLDNEIFYEHDDIDEDEDIPQFIPDNDILS